MSLVDELPDDETGQILAEMSEAGIDLTLQHDVVFFQLFEKQADAEAMLAHLRELDAEIQAKVHPDEIPNVWDLDCIVKMVPNHEDINAKELELERIAAKFNGYNDGWGIEA